MNLLPAPPGFDAPGAALVNTSPTRSDHLEARS
ncbi:hypothetical protein J2X34_001268 [Rhodococcus sp. BE178]